MIGAQPVNFTPEHVIRALGVIHDGASSNADRAEAQKLVDSLKLSPTAHEVAFGLLRGVYGNVEKSSVSRAKTDPAQQQLNHSLAIVQHFAFSLLVSSFKTNWNKWQDAERESAKSFLLSLHAAYFASNNDYDVKNYVRSK